MLSQVLKKIEKLPKVQNSLLFSQTQNECENKSKKTCNKF